MLKCVSCLVFKVHRCVFVDNVKILINALGYKVLDPLLQIGTDVTSADDEELFILIIPKSVHRKS